jgi:hypothetical protein
LSHRFYNAALYGFDTANVNAFFQNAMFSAIFLQFIIWVGSVSNNKQRPNFRLF